MEFDDGKNYNNFIFNYYEYQNVVQNRDWV